MTTLAEHVDILLAVFGRYSTCNNPNTVRADGLRQEIQNIKEIAKYDYVFTFSFGFSYKLQDASYLRRFLTHGISSPTSRHPRTFSNRVAVESLVIRRQLHPINGFVLFQ